MNQIKILFNGYEEVLNVINDPVKLLEMGFPSDACSLFGKEIKMLKLLGKGVNGEVFSVHVDGMGDRLFAVKKEKSPPPTLFEGDIEEFLNSDEIMLVNYRKSKEGKKLVTKYRSEPNQDIEILIPSVYEDCPLTEKVYTSFTSGKVITLPQGSIICDLGLYTEFIISVYAGKLYRDGICAHFFNTYALITCDITDYNKILIDDNITISQFMFMDKIDATENDIQHCLRLKTYKKFKGADRFRMMNSVFAQVLFAIHTYQSVYQISHNDLHVDNVFIEYITEKTMFNNQLLLGADYFHYRFFGKDYYFPYTPFVVKIGDFGTVSIKYSQPVVGLTKAFDNGWDMNISNEFIPIYDQLFFTVDYMSHFSPDFNHHDYSPLLRVTLSEMLGKYILLKEAVESLYKGGIKNGYPDIQQLHTLKDTKEIILNNSEWKKYTVKPKIGRIVTMGKIG
jgi:hypothetical protein